MRKVIAAINLTLDGYCDHTAVIADEDLHYHYADLLDSAGVILYGRITYQLMEFWKTVLTDPTVDQSMYKFAEIIDRTPKIVFSNTLQGVDWHSARLSERSPEEEITELRQQPGKDILIGSRSLILSLTNQHLIDEYQLCIHPVIAAKGLPFYNEIKERNEFRLLRTKTLGSGAVVHYYEPMKS